MKTCGLGTLMAILDMILWDKDISVEEKVKIRQKIINILNETRFTEVPNELYQEFIELKFFEK